MVHGCVPRAHDRSAGRLDGGRRRRPRARRRPHRVGQDARRLPLGARRPARRSGARRTRSSGAGSSTSRRSRRWPRTSSGTCARRWSASGRPRPGSADPAGRDRRHPHRRHPAQRAPGLRDEAAGHPHHHARVAVPRADVGRPRRPRGRAHGDRRRDPRGRRHQARRAPRAVARAARRPPRPPRRSRTGAADRPVGHRPPGRRGRGVPGRRPHARGPGATRSSSCSRHRPRRSWSTSSSPCRTCPTCAARRPADDELDLSGAAAGELPRPSIWPHVEERVVDLVAAHRSTLVFTNSRRGAERLDGADERGVGRAVGRGRARSRDPPRGAGPGAVRHGRRRRHPRGRDASWRARTTVR